jgi:hypothetical protein
MAFVVRSNRDMNFYQYEKTRIGKGEYIDLKKNKYKLPKIKNKKNN